MRERRSYPRHAYPLLLAVPSQDDARLVAGPATRPLSPRARRVLQALHLGARILFDMTHGRALLYRFGRGIETVAELTVRTLAQLVKQGYLARTGRDGRLVHYGLVR